MSSPVPPPQPPPVIPTPGGSTSRGGGGGGGGMGTLRNSLGTPISSDESYVTLCEILDGKHIRTDTDHEELDTLCESMSSAQTADSRFELLRGKSGRIVADPGRLEEVEEELRDCGMGVCRPGCVQHLANIKMFIISACLLATLSGTLTAGYFNSVITTIEKRFEIGSSISGLIAASYEFGSLVSVIFVSYLGGRRHIPHWIGAGVVIMATGALLFFIPHVIAPKYTVLGRLDSNFTEENICHDTSLNNDDLIAEQFCTEEGSGYWVYVLILVLAQFLIGTGGTPLFTLGTTYIDDHVPKQKAPAYISFIYAAAAVGPVLGFILGALMLQYYVDIFAYDMDNLNLTTDDPRWVGAWWAGFVICGGLLLVVSILFFSFPKTLHAEKFRLQEMKDEGFKDLMATMDHCGTGGPKKENYGRTIKDIPQSMLKLLCNPIYMLTSFGISCEIAIVSGFVTFLPKYLETQYGISKSIANLFTGGIAIPGAVIGTLVGGYILKKLKLRPKGAVQLVMLLNTLCLLGFTFFFFLGCDNLKIAGATLPYFNSSGHSIFQANLTSSCNIGCDCSNNDLEPICGINGITYFSPCHAGCTQFYGPSAQKLLNYSGCACIMGNISMPEEVVMSPLATSGPCQRTCDTLVPFMCLLFFMTLLVASTQMPLLMLTMRSVAEEERAFSLGMQFCILRLFAYIPAPIMFGNTIDSTCLAWKKQCGSRGSCLLYDIVSFRNKYAGVSAGLKFLGLVFFIAVWALIRKQNRRDLEKTMPVSDIIKSVSSINSLGDNDDAYHAENPWHEAKKPRHNRTRKHNNATTSASGHHSLSEHDNFSHVAFESAI